MTTTGEELTDKSTIAGSATAYEHFFSMSRGSLISEYEVELMSSEIEVEVVDTSIDIEIEAPIDIEITETTIDVEV